MQEERMQKEGSPPELELPKTVDVEVLKSLVFSRPWFHTIDLGHGVITPGVDQSWAKLQLLEFPGSLAGKTVLDVGAYDGFFSFEAERRGAARVVAADEFCWSRPADPMTDGRGFDIAHWALQSKVEKRRIAVEDISPESVGTFDYVFFLGVLYHSPDPLGYLRRVHSVCSRTLILETHVDGLDYERPTMVFYPGATLGDDPSNFWGPNPKCVIEMLREVGFGRIELVSQQGSRLAVHAHR
jgi:tRNA (mo5U34)-methyltransferase